MSLTPKEKQAAKRGTVRLYDKDGKVVWGKVVRGKEKL